MKITHIKTNGFRKFKDNFETELYDITSITGANCKGKTNILYAIVWAFLGSNLNGNDKVWLGNNKSDGCKVEVTFIDNKNIKHNLTRYRHKYDNKKNYLLLDNKEIKDDALVTYYNDKKLFLSVMCPTYFTDKSPTEQKALIDKYLPNIDMQKVYEKLDVNEKKLLEGVPKNMAEYIKELNADIKMYDNNVKNLRGKIDYARQYAEKDIEPKKVFEKQEDISLTEQEIEHLIKEQTMPERTNQQHIVNHLEKELANAMQEIEDLKVQMMTGKKTYLSIKAENASFCPMCNQEIKNESKNITIANMYKELTEMNSKKQKREADVNDLKARVMVEKCKLHTFDNNEMTEKEIQDELEKAKNLLKSLKAEQLEVEQFNSKIDSEIKNKNGAKADIEIFEKDIAKNKEAKENAEKAKKIAQKLYINYIEEKMKLAKEYLKDVDIKHYTVLKDSGEIKDSFIITYKGNEFKHLSKSETIATSVELRNMFNKISKSNLPLFIDDTESCADYNFVQNLDGNTQVIISKVEKGQKLQITDYEQASILQAA